MIRLLIVLALAAALQGQQAPVREGVSSPSAGTATIAGSVVADDNERTPLRRVTLTLVRSGLGETRMTSTDDKGRYLFTGLAAGLYTLNATKGAYVPGSYGATRIGLPGNPIPLADGQMFTAGPIVLIRGAVVTGRLTTPSLQGLRSVSVEAVQVQTVNGVRRRRSISGGFAGATTDSRGVYRIYGLAPGDYVISARATAERPGADGLRRATAEELRWAASQVAGGSTTASQPANPVTDPPLGRTTADAPTYYPGTADVAGATVVSLQKGEERAGLDFGLQHVPTARLTALVLGPDGQPASNVSVFRLARGASVSFDYRFTLSVTQTGPEGQVSLSNIPPGTHSLLARAALQGRSWWGSVDVPVNGEDIDDIRILLQPAMAVAGRIVFEGATAPPVSRTPFAPRVNSSVAFSAPGAAARLDSDGSFRIEGVAPGSYRFVAGTPGNSAWTPKSAMLGGRDLLDEFFEMRPGEDLSSVVVTYTDRPAELSGTLVDATGRPAPQFFVMAYSTNRSFWTPSSRRVRPVRAGIDGSYRIPALPPGEYFLCALTELDIEQQYDPVYLEQFVPASIKVTIADGEKKVQSLRIGG